MRGFIAGFLLVSALSMGVEQAKADVTAGLVGRWELDGNGNGFPGLNHDATVYGATATTDRFGVASHASFFDGSSTSYVSVPGYPELNPPGAVTFTAWFRPQSFGPVGWPTVLRNGYDYGMQASWLDQGTPKMSASTTTNGSPGYAQPGYTLPTLSTGLWYFGAGVYNGTSMSLYIGQYQTTLGVESLPLSGTIAPNSADLNIGRDGVLTNLNRYFNGAIDDVRIYNRALTFAQVDEVYHVPEPSTLVLLGIGAIGLLAYVWRRRRTA